MQIEEDLILIPESIHISGVINLAIWFYKKILYLSYILTLQNTQHQ